jgi:hypothetical protein
MEPAPVIVTEPILGLPGRSCSPTTVLPYDGAINKREGTPWLVQADKRSVTRRWGVARLELDIARLGLPAAKTYEKPFTLDANGKAFLPFSEPGDLFKFAISRKDKDVSTGISGSTVDPWPHRPRIGAYRTCVEPPMPLL